MSDYSIQRIISHISLDEVNNVWKDSSNAGRPSLSVPLLLAPYSGYQLATPQCHQIVSATFEYIKNSSRRL